MPQPTHPNIVIIVSDQLSQRAVGAYGDPRKRTPNIDRIAASGARFADAYTTCPLCMPARASLWTGQYAHRTGVPANGRLWRVPPEMPTLGTLFATAGYRCVHFGKTHDAGSLIGFGTLDSWRCEVEPTPPWDMYGATRIDRYTAGRAVAFLEETHDSPFALVADFANPHDICGWVGDHAGPHTDEPVPGDLPELPANFERTDFDKRPAAVRFNCCDNKRVAQTAVWNEDNFRHYLAAYYHYVDLVDREIGKTLDALSKRADAGNTLVVFLTDHGEAMAAHRMVTKAGHFYEEVVRMPLVFAGAGIGPRGRCVENALASTIDVLPTLCEFAGVPAPDGLPGRSLMPYLRGDVEIEGREYVLGAWHGGQTRTPARMLRTSRYKYTRYREDEGEELFDLVEDPGETRTLADDPARAAVLEAHRALLREHCERTGDPFFDETAEGPPGYHAHAAEGCAVNPLS